MDIERKADVLLVDDQPSNLIALGAVLGELGLNLVEARSGEEALRRVLDGDFAVILMDVQMPGMDGFETAALIRERDRSSRTPIIFLTAYESSQVQVFQGYALGAVDYLSKPIVPTVLRSKVAVFVELFEKTEQVKRQARQLYEGQRREHERGLAEEKRRWELERLREESAREREAAEASALRAEELARNVAERVRAEEQLSHRAAQQAAVAGLGQRALAGTDLDSLLADAVDQAARELEVDYVAVMELTPEGDRLVLRAGVGWDEPAAGRVQAGAVPTTLEGFTVLNDEPVVVEDLAAETRFEASPLLGGHGVVGGVSLVIQGRERPYGTLGVYCPRPRSFTRDDVNFLQAVSNVLASAIQRKRDDEDLAAVRDELAVQLDDMTRLHSLVSRLSNTLELSAVLEEVIAAVTGMQGTDRGVLMLFDRERNLMTTAASVGFSAGELDPAGGEDADADADAGPDGSVSAVFCGGLVVEDAPADPVLTPHLSAARRAGYVAVCSTPLLTSVGELVGSIATYFPRTHRPSVRETRLVELYARQAAESIDNARLYRAIREADHHKGEFLAMLAHELRNPLAPILNALYILRLDGVDPESAGQARAVAEQQVRHLARLVDDLLDVSRISSGKIQLRTDVIDLRDAVGRSVETARPHIEGSRHELSVSVPEGPLWLHADSARLEQVLANLLNNAAKYTEPGGAIELVAAREGDDAVVRVRDSGIGIAPELLPRVFDLFTQADRSLDRSQGGLGIGLTLVRRLVELHGGSVSASSRGLGRGSEFVVRVPIGAAPGATEEAGGAAPDAATFPATDARPKRVLVVDDNIQGAMILARVLKSCGHETEVAHDGPTALEIASARPLDVVLLDIGLPGMDGYEVARRLRKVDGMDRVLLVALTGYGQEEDRERSRQAGLDLHLVKPIDPHTLTLVLARHQAHAPGVVEGPT